VANNPWVIVLIVLLVLLAVASVAACVYVSHWKRKKELELLGYPASTISRNTSPPPQQQQQQQQQPEVVERPMKQQQQQPQVFYTDYPGNYAATPPNKFFRRNREDQNGVRAARNFKSNERY